MGNENIDCPIAHKTTRAIDDGNVKRQEQHGFKWRYCSIAYKTY